MKVLRSVVGIRSIPSIFENCKHFRDILVKMLRFLVKMLHLKFTKSFRRS